MSRVQAEVYRNLLTICKTLIGSLEEEHASVVTTKQRLTDAEGRFDEVSQSAGQEDDWGGERGRRGGILAASDSCIPLVHRASRRRVDKLPLSAAL